MERGIGIEIDCIVEITEEITNPCCSRNSEEYAWYLQEKIKKGVRFRYQQFYDERSILRVIKANPGMDVSYFFGHSETRELDELLKKYMIEVDPTIEEIESLDSQSKANLIPSIGEFMKRLVVRLLRQKKEHGQQFICVLQKLWKEGE